MDLPRVLRLAQAMGHPPRRVVVVGIEGENFADGVGLSPAVELAVTRSRGPRSPGDRRGELDVHEQAPPGGHCACRRLDDS